MLQVDITCQLPEAGTEWMGKDEMHLQLLCPSVLHSSTETDTCSPGGAVPGPSCGCTSGWGDTSSSDVLSPSSPACSWCCSHSQLFPSLFLVLFPAIPIPEPSLLSVLCLGQDHTPCSQPLLHCWF